MATLKIQLRQHTPIIHFQHDREYATIRATELKPKLDRFLKDRAPDLPFDEHGALKYKVRIKAGRMSVSNIEEPNIDPTTGQQRRDWQNRPIWKQFPLFFGNMGEDNQREPKKFVFSEEPAEVQILCFESDVMKAIKEHVAVFFMRTTFGMRQTKGFGSFYLDPSDPLYKQHPASLSYRFTVNTDQIQEGREQREWIQWGNWHQLWAKWRALYCDIALFYRSLRSGINEIRGRAPRAHTVFYFKSMMFLYFKEKYKKQWDKKSIKQEYFPGELLIQQGRHIDPNGPVQYNSECKAYPYELLVKDLLGLSSEETWRFYNAKITKKHIGEIVRYKSPLFFKPIRTGTGYDVWFDADTIPRYYFEKNFDIKNNGCGSLQLTTPKWTEFDIHEFIRFAVSKDLSRHVEIRFHNTIDFNRLTGIYSEIKNCIPGGRP
ncbi:MAG: hypothetical protein JXB23_04055 [Candidatus Aminicenantes bacterium]|nr:hypothetical protein [Candidatus Aminicenantes bacterium]